jgi:zinc protease
MIFDRQKKPEPQTELNFNLPQAEEFILDNGLKVVHIFKDKLPFVRLNLMLDAGSKFDAEDKKGLAYLTSLLLDEGADDLDSLELSDEFDMLGSNFSVSSDNDLINISLQSLTDKIERSFELFSKVLLKPKFSKVDFQREKSKLSTRILQSKDEPDYLADQIFDRVVLGNSSGYSFPQLGFEETVQSISVDDVKEHYKNFFSPYNAALIVVGDVDKTILLSLLNKYLSNWISKKNEITFPNETISQNKKIYLFHKAGSVQTEIRVGHISEKRNQENYFQRYLLNTILGGQFTSRINLNLRERNGYTYGGTSRFQYYKNAAFFEVATSVGIENTANALKEILFELENIQNGISDDELTFAKLSITKKFPLNFETYRQIASGLAGKILFDLPNNYFDTYINDVNAVTKTEVENAAQKFIHNNKLSIVLVGDKNIMMEKVNNLGIDFCEVDEKGGIVS